MKKETMKMIYEGCYKYKDVLIHKQHSGFRCSEVSWVADGKSFLTLKEARVYIDELLN